MMHGQSPPVAKLPGLLDYLCRCRSCVVVFLVYCIWPWNLFLIAYNTTTNNNNHFWPTKPRGRTWARDQAVAAKLDNSMQKDHWEQIGTRKKRQKEAKNNLAKMTWIWETLSEQAKMAIRHEMCVCITMSYLYTRKLSEKKRIRMAI